MSEPTAASSGAPIFIDIDPVPEYNISDELNSQDVEMLSQDIKSDEAENTVDTQQEHESSGEGNEENTNDYITIPEKRLKCPECSRFSAENEDQMVRHIRKCHRGENPFKCYMCEYDTYNKAVFEEHIRIHKGIKPFKCKYCPYRSASKKNTKKHEMRHRPDNPLKCDECPFIARHNASLENHKYLHKNPYCAKCNFMAKDPQELQNHVKNNCDNSPACSGCSTKFPDEITLKRHKKGFKKCEKCELFFCTQYMLRRHMVKVHNYKRHMEEFVCAICLWKSTSKCKVLLHLIHHPNQSVDESVYDLSVLRKYGIVN